MRFLSLAFIATLCLQFSTFAAEPGERTVLVIHGGAGVLSEQELKEPKVRQAYETALAEALSAGYQLHKEGKTSLDVVEAAIRVLEDSPLFNAGRGAAFTSDGRVELDAALMLGTPQGRGDGKQDLGKQAGAVAAVSHIKNPISAARAVLEMPDSRHVMLVGEGAEVFALSEANRKKYNLERVSNAYFWTDRRASQIQKEILEERARAAKATDSQGALVPRPARPAELRFGTVGAVALSNDKHIAAGTSTGGLTNKHPGRVGDSPIIGAGTYADDRTCGVSCTGTGEVFIRHAVAHDVVAKLLYKAEATVKDAAQKTIDELPDEEDGGVGALIALDKGGQHAFAMSPKTLGMYRGYVTDKGHMFVAILATDKLKPIALPKPSK